MHLTLPAAAMILIVVALMEEKELARRFGPAHARYVASVPNYFFPVPIFPLPRSLIAKSSGGGATISAATKKIKNSDVDPDDDVAVEQAFADDDAEDAIPTQHQTTMTTSMMFTPTAKSRPRPPPGVAGSREGPGVAQSPPSTPDPYEFKDEGERCRLEEREENRDKKKEENGKGVARDVTAAANADATATAAAAAGVEIDDDTAAMFPDADELMSAMTTQDGCRRRHI